MTNAAELYLQSPDKPHVWETVGASLRLMVERPLQVILPLAIVQVPVTVVAIATRDLVSDGETPVLGMLVLVGLLMTLLTVPGVGATVLAVAGLGWSQPMATGEAFAWVFRRFLPLYVLSAMLWILGLPFALFGAMTVDRGGLAVLAMVVWAVPFFYLSLRFGVSTQLLLLEGHGPIEALRRSWSTMKGYMLRLLGIFALEGVIGGVIGAVAALVSFLTDPSSAVLTIVAHLIGFPFTVAGVVAVTLYFLRINSIRLATERTSSEAWEPA